MRTQFTTVAVTVAVNAFVHYRLALRQSAYGLMRSELEEVAEGVGFEPTRACTLAVFKPTSALYFTLTRFVRRRSPTFAIVRRRCRHRCRQKQLLTGSSDHPGFHARKRPVLASEDAASGPSASFCVDMHLLSGTVRLASNDGKW
jgi:hypothetical protein